MSPWFFYLIGCSTGAAGMWAWFRLNGLIRSREEWYRYRGICLECHAPLSHGTHCTRCERDA